ncbi:MAG: hypothetical protein KDH94_05795, partial [Coxiellaceae bacterium]|nr:hypothetical protein [Coxiellaceae bacterium]
ERFTATAGVSKQGNVQKMYEWWQQHGEYSHYTSMAIWYEATELLEELKEYCYYASLELAKRKKALPYGIMVAYRGYLASLKKEIAVRHAALCWAMIARLRVADARGDYKTDDVTRYLASWLQSHGLMNANAQLLSTTRKELTPALFMKFHNYICCNGTQKQKDALMQSGWLKSSTDFVTLFDSEGMYIIPTIFEQEKLIPSKPWLPRLFLNRQARYAIFRDKTWLMVNLKNLSVESQEKVGYVELKNTLQHCDEVENELRKFEQECLIWQPHGLMKYLFSSAYRFFAYCSSFIVDQKRKILRVKTNAIIAYVAKLDDFISRVVDFSEVFPVDEVSEIVNMIRQVLRNSMDDVLTQKLEASLLSLEAMMKRTQEIPSCFEQEAARQEPNNDPLVLKSMGVLETMNDIDLFALSNAKFTTLIYSLSQAVLQISQSNDDGGKQLVNNMLIGLFLNYLAYNIRSTSSTSVSNNSRLAEVEAILRQFGPGDVVQRVSILQLLRAQQVDPFVYQLRCEAFIFSYQTCEEIKYKLLMKNVDNCVGNISENVSHDEQMKKISVI